MDWKILIVQFTLVILILGVSFLFFNRYSYQDIRWGNITYLIKINKLNNDICVAHIAVGLEDYLEDIGLDKCK